ncbi:phosphoribosylglycinamide formyltransferase [Thalassococcus sp. S3]|uniref:phosphoribosylglycinamide formyltransferase n=1 Tax=Thalassococcus sp. S3 TaxID=2017482 RepID=UPI001024409F|nr:phosphoribosylglycinamide formyltransferase [Thalassococcus sp. S3]QBF32109.1 phosphoribosylglycinamide formyltransferase [Thalassococcus sp. S3]
MSRKKVAILISGSGSNMLALLDDMQADHPAEPCLVLSNDPAAPGLAKAAARGIDVASVDHRVFGRDRSAFEAELMKPLLAAGPDIVCLAGFMRILTAGFVSHWQGRMLNIHPSLLPRYKGLDTHARALDAGDARHGCTVHEVTPALDDGPLLGQADLEIRPGDTPATLAARVLDLEHRLYPAVLRRYAQGDRTPLFLTSDAA